MIEEIYYGEKIGVKTQQTKIRDLKVGDSILLRVKTSHYNGTWTTTDMETVLFVVEKIDRTFVHRHLYVEVSSRKFSVKIMNENLDATVTRLRTIN